MKLSFKDCLKLIGSVFVLYLGIHYWSSAAALAKLMLSAGFPLILGGAIAYVVNILMSSYEKRYQFTGKLAFLMKARRPVCLLGAYVTLVAVVVMVVWLVLPQLVDAVQLIIAELPGFISEVLDWVEQWGLLSPEVLSRLEAIKGKHPESGVCLCYLRHRQCDGCGGQHRELRILRSGHDTGGCHFLCVSALFQGEDGQAVPLAGRSLSEA